MKELNKAERLTLLRIQKRTERVKGIETLLEGKDIINELKEGILKGMFEEGTFYRVMDPKELRKIKTRYPLNIYVFVNRDKKINEESYGYKGLIQVEIKGMAVPYNPGKAEEEMLLYSAKRLKVIKFLKGE